MIFFMFDSIFDDCRKDRFLPDGQSVNLVNGEKILNTLRGDKS